MAEINVKLNGRMYGIACDDGQEERVHALSEFVDNRLSEIARGGGATGESHLLVLTALVLADEIYDMRESMENMIQNTHAPHEESVSHQEEALIVQAIDTLAHRIDSIAGRIESA